jgi:septal ring factor EnvC (AmiA/AmiB activator)
VEQIIIAIIGGVVAVIVALVGMWSKLKQQTIEITEETADQAKITKRITTDKLIETLNSTVGAQTKQIEILRAIVDEQRLELAEREREIEDLRERVSNLERLTVQQALLIGELEKSKGRVRREPRHSEGGETEIHD